MEVSFEPWRRGGSMADEASQVLLGSGLTVLRHLRCTEALPVPRGNLPCSGLCPAPLVLALGTTDRAWTRSLRAAFSCLWTWRRCL